MDKLKDAFKYVYSKKKKDRVTDQPMTASYRRARAPGEGPSNPAPRMEAARHSSFHPGRSFNDPALQIPAPPGQTVDDSAMYDHIPRRRMPVVSSSSSGWSAEPMNSTSFAIEGEGSHHMSPSHGQMSGGDSSSGARARPSHARADQEFVRIECSPYVDDDGGAADDDDDESPATEEEDDDNDDDDVMDHEEDTDEEAALRMVAVIPTAWKLTEVPVPGGPLLTSVITSFGGHVALDLWCLAQDRGVLSFKSRKVMLSSWPKEEVSCKRARNMIRYSGLEHIQEITMPYNNMSLISAFVERWQPDTNSFHMPFGEMTITLHDVWMILQIPIVGRAVQGNSSTPELKEVMAECLGFGEDVQIMIETLWNTGAVSMAGLVQHCRFGPTQPMKQSCGWLYHLIGTTILAGKSNGRLSPQLFWLLSPMRRATKLNKYAWGAGTLAWLYRQLGIASRAGSGGIGGSMTLLECWIYAYFPSLRPAISPDWRAQDDRPWALRWVRSNSQIHDHRALQNYREHLDALTALNIDWLPYGRENVDVHGGRTWYRGTLQIMGINEPYMPERCLRQFGYVQCIPPHPIRPNSRSEKRGKKQPYTCVYPPMYSVWDSTPKSLVPSPSYIHTRARLHACVPEYQDWYTKHTHPKILNPESHDNTLVHRPDPALLLSEANELARPYYPGNRTWEWSYYRQGMPEDEQRATTHGIEDVFSSLSIWDDYQRQYGAP